MKKSVAFKVGLFLTLSLFLIAAALVYLLVRKGVFNDYANYTLLSASGDDISEGMSLLFSGFEIGKVNRLKLNDEGSVVITVRVSEDHAGRINKSSVFTLERPLIGSAKFVVTTPDLKAQPASESDVFQVQTVDDINMLIKKLQPMLEKIDTIASNIDTLTSARSNLSKTLENTEKITSNLASKHGLIEMLSGDKVSSEKFKESIDHANNSLQGVEDLINAANKTIETANTRLFEKDGTVDRINDIVTDINGKMVELDKLINSLIKSGENLQAGTHDLDVLRKDVDMIVNSINSMVKDVRNALPISQEKEIKLP